MCNREKKQKAKRSSQNARKLHLSPVAVALQ